MNEHQFDTVTGATGYTGRYITRNLLQQGRRVQSITGHPDRPNPFGDQVPLHPFSFDDPQKLEQTLRGTDTLFNTYWIRVDHGGHTHQQCVEQTKVMFDAAKRAGVRRIVHISITNPDPESDLPYFRGKGQLEQYLQHLGLSHAILRPTVLYSLEDVLLNNIAWSLRRFPAVFLPGSGSYSIQPVHIQDLADLAVRVAPESENIQLNAVGPEVYSYAGLVRLVRYCTRTRCAILPMPSSITYLAGKAIGAFMGDILLTRDEIKGLSRNLLTTRDYNPQDCPTRLSDWLGENGDKLGQTYANEVKRHYS